MKNFFKKYDYLFITMGLGLVVIGLIYMLQKVSPFGNHSLLTIDFYHQYGPMMAELYNRVLNGSNLIYSFNMGMGLPFFRNFFNYLSSPFNIVLFLFKHKDLLTAYSIIIGLKAVLSAGTMSYYLNNKFKKNYMFIALSILYAFCAYFTAYYWNIMWLDGLVMLPLVAYGIELLVNKNKILFYAISLVIMLFANYFIGFMICIFSVLYFICYLIIKTDKFDFKYIFKKCLYFGLASLLAGGICAIFLIPMYFALRSISATNDIFPKSQYYAFTFKDFIFNHFSGVGSTVLKSGITTAPNISVGVLPIALLIIFIINPKIDIKIKLCYIWFLIILVLSNIMAPLDFIWHAFHVPNDLPYRYSFIYSFIMIILSAYSIDKIKNVKSLYMGIIYVIMLIFITVMKYSDYENINDDMILMNYVIITISYLCYIIYHYFNKYSKYALIFMMLTAGLECVMVVNNNWNIDQDMNSFYSDYDSISKDNDKDIYRLEKDDILTFNDPSWYDYYGMVTFSSMEYYNMAVMQYYLGMPGNEINSYYYRQNTPIYDMMFNLKYIIGDVKGNNYDLFYEDNDTYVYRNKYNLGLMFGVSDKVKNWENNFQNVPLNQNDFIYKTTDISDVLKEVDYISEIVYTDDDKSIVKYDIKNINDMIYLYPTSYNIDFIVVNNTLYYVNDNYQYVNDYSNIQIYNYESYNERFIISEYCNNSDIDIYVAYSAYYRDEFNIYKIDNDKLNDVYDILSKKKVDITYFSENYIKGEYTALNDEVIYTSIPYDDGWEVYIDGIKQDSFDIGGALLGFDISSGKHIIELKYRIPYINVGLVISLLSLGGLVIFNKFKKEN